MPTVDRRIARSQEAMKHALIELMQDKDLEKITIQEIADKANIGKRTVYLHYADKYALLEKLIEEHIEELRRLCRMAKDLDFVEANLIWFEYFESHHSFFSTMLASKGAPYFRSRFLDLVMEELKGDVMAMKGENKGLSKDVILHFFGNAIVGTVEAYLKKEIPDPPQAVAEQVGLLLDRSLL